MRKLVLITLLMVASYAHGQANSNPMSAVNNSGDLDPATKAALDDASKANSSTQPPATSTSTTRPVDPLQESIQESRKNAAIKTGAGGAPIVVHRPRPTPPPVDPDSLIMNRKHLTSEEAMMLKSMDDKQKTDAQAQQDAQALASDPSAPPAPRLHKRKPIYVPAPVDDTPNTSYRIERDSPKIITKYMSPNDALDVKVCFSSGLSIVLDQSIPDVFQRVILDDKIFFDATEMENQRGVYIRLKRPITLGQNWESAIRLVRKSDDKTYLFNLIGVGCPATGLTPYPKVIYIKEKLGMITGNNKILTPEDTIIALSKGLPRLQKNRIRVYDMVASSTSQWVVFGVEVQYPGAVKDGRPQATQIDPPKFLILDNYQVSVIPSRLDYLPVHSLKATELRGVSTLRFKLTVNIDKNYIMQHRYIHLMFLDEEGGYYQYVRIDTLPYFLSLTRRGFEL